MCTTGYTTLACATGLCAQTPDSLQEISSVREQSNLRSSEKIYINENRYEVWLKQWERHGGRKYIISLVERHISVLHILCQRS